MAEDSYNKIAGFYDSVIGDYSDTTEFLDLYLKKFEKKGKHLPELLELGCGTGNNLYPLRNKFNLTGIDISGQMLKIARKKIPEAQLLQSDIRDFSFDKKFDVAICLYDTINHLTLFSDWKRVFRCVHMNLKDSGLFIFDINTLYKLENLALISPVINKTGSDFLIADISRQSKNVFNWNLKVFKNLKSNVFQLTEVNIKESSFELSKLISELNSYFKVLKTVEESGKKADENSERIYFVCRKK